MKHRSILFAGLILFVSSTLFAQSSGIGLSPIGPERLPALYSELAQRYETLNAERERWYQASLDSLYSRYATSVNNGIQEEALRDGQRAAEYVAALESELSSIREQNTEIDEAERLLQAEFVALLQTDPPRPGSPAARAVFEWAAARVPTTPQRRDMVRALLGIGSASGSTEERDAFLNALGGQLFAPDVLGRGDSLLVREALELLAVQLLLVPGSGLQEFTSLLAPAVELLGVRGAEAASRIEQQSELERIESRLLDRRVSAAPLAAVTPALFASGTDSDPAPGDLEQELGRELLLIRTNALGLTGERARSAPAVEFLVERVDSLLLAAGRLEQRRFATRTGLSSYEVTRLRQDLYAIRTTVGPPALLTELRWREETANSGSSDEAGLPAFYPPIAPSDEASGRIEPARQRVYRLYLQLGEENAEAVLDLQLSSDPRAGDEYRWTMLSALGHPYALYLLSTEERFQAASRLVDQFVQSVYEQAARVAGFSFRFVNREAPVGLSRYDSTVVAETAEQVPLIYQAFVQAAQGLDSLPENYLDDYAPGISQAEHWAHLHGLHVVVPADSALTGEPERWFSLAAQAEVPDEQFAHQVRGLHAFSEEMRSLDAEAARRGLVSLTPVSPRMASAQAWAYAAVSFLRTTPDAMMAVEFRLGISTAEPWRPALSKYRQQLANVIARLGEVAETDRRAFQLARGGLTSE